jgi:hypothetical protein
LKRVTHGGPAAGRRASCADLRRPRSGERHRYLLCTHYCPLGPHTTVPYPFIIILAAPLSDTEPKYPGTDRLGIAQAASCSALEATASTFQHHGGTPSAGGFACRRGACCTQGMAQLQAGRPAKAASPPTALLIMATLAMLSTSLACPADMLPSVKAREDMRLSNHLSSYHRNRAVRSSLKQHEHREQARSGADPM